MLCACEYMQRVCVCVHSCLCVCMQEHACECVYICAHMICVHLVFLLQTWSFTGKRSQFVHAWEKSKTKAQTSSPVFSSRWQTVTREDPASLSFRSSSGDSGPLGAQMPPEGVFELLEGARWWKRAGWCQPEEGERCQGRKARGKKKAFSRETFSWGVLRRG